MSLPQDDREYIYIQYWFGGRTQSILFVISIRIAFYS